MARSHDGPASFSPLIEQGSLFPECLKAPGKNEIPLKATTKCIGTPWGFRLLLRRGHVITTDGPTGFSDLLNEKNPDGVATKVKRNLTSSASANWVRTTSGQLELKPPAPGLRAQPGEHLAKAVKSSLTYLFETAGHLSAIWQAFHTSFCQLPIFFIKKRTRRSILK